MAEGIHNANSPLAVLGTTRNKYTKIASDWTATFLEVSKEKYEKFILNYGDDAFWEHVNMPFVQKEIIDKGKNVVLTTSIDIVKNVLPKTSNTYRELTMLLKTEKYVPLGKNAPSS